MSDSWWVKAPCPHCGDVRLPPQRILLSVFPAGATYSFRCLCGRRVVNDATPWIVAVLRDVDVPEQTIVLPPRTPVDLPPIDPEEILDLHEALQRDGWADELRA